MPRTTAPSEPPVDEPSAEELPVDPPPAEAPPAGRGFFGWLERLDIPRRPGWIGGVCAGLAERIGVDPVLVRGVAVVIAVLGGPAVLVYALAWFLLPDGQGTIHARELGRGRVTRALPGIVGVFLLSFLPVAQGVWFAGSLYWGDPGAGGVVLRVVWTAVVITLAIVAVVWLARRSSGDVTTGATTTDEVPSTTPPPAAAEPNEPPAPPADASAADLASWRASQDEWRRQRAAWTADQRRTDAELRRAAQQARAAAHAEAYREQQRIERITRPRVHAGVVALLFGLGLVAAAIAAWIAQSDADLRPVATLVGAAVLVLVLGTGTVVVALARRRSGGLTALGILAVVALLLSIGAAVTSGREVLPIGGYGIDRSRDGSYARLSGTTQLWVYDRPADADVPLIDLWQLDGYIGVQLDEGASVRLELTSDDPDADIHLFEELADGSRTSFYRLADGRLVVTFGDGEPDAVFRVWFGGRTTFEVSSLVPVPADRPAESIIERDADGAERPVTESETEGPTP